MPPTQKLLVVVLWCVALGVALTGCGERQDINCIQPETGLVLHSDLTRLVDMQYGFYGVDAQGYTHEVPRREVSQWVCKAGNPRR